MGSFPYRHHQLSIPTALSRFHTFFSTYFSTPFTLTFYLYDILQFFSPRSLEEGEEWSVSTTRNGELDITTMSYESRRQDHHQYHTCSTGLLQRIPTTFRLCIFFLFFSCVPQSSFCSHTKGLNLSWHRATATWYGDPEGDGSTGGACGYGSLVDVRPFRARVGAVSDVLFMGGEGCGACYKVKCLDRSICSRRAATIIVTDECPGGWCSAGRMHFDLSGGAFGHMAQAGKAASLRNKGDIPIIFRRTPCTYRGKNIAFHVNEGSTNFWLSLLVEYEDGDGDIGSMQIKQSTSTIWLDMKHIWGATWCIVGGPLHGPFSVRLTTLTTKKILSARDVIPKNWTPKVTYRSRLNFKPKE